jgi:hypothetical protein
MGERVERALFFLSPESCKSVSAADERKRSPDGQPGRVLKGCPGASVQIVADLLPRASRLVPRARF